MENSSFYWSSLALDFWVSDKQYQEQGLTWNVFAVSDIVWKRWTMIILPRLDEIFLFNVEPGRKEQGSRCWRCWTRPLGSRCPRSCLSSSPGQDIVQKWDIEAVSRRLLARSHLNVLHLDTLHLFFSSHLDVLQAFASQLAAQSLCQLVAKVSRAP